MSEQQLTLRQRMVPVAILLASAFMVWGLGYAGTSDYEQAVADQALYCQMVEEGVWPKEPGRSCESDSERHVASL